MDLANCIGSKRRALQLATYIKAIKAYRPSANEKLHVDDYGYSQNNISQQQFSI
ncbi:hypothetical protein ABWW58_12290 [Sporolactobacillus sp. STCC-11]|uniref:hypothetical protein n=1 Tax=Sporolactobacillus caesalpiniae TaxID=3230362 RepID=UPI00339A4C3C